MNLLLICDCWLYLWTCSQYNLNLGSYGVIYMYAWDKLIHTFLQSVTCAFCILVPSSGNIGVPPLRHWCRHLVLWTFRCVMPTLGHVMVFFFLLSFWSLVTHTMLLPVMWPTIQYVFCGVIRCTFLEFGRCKCYSLRQFIICDWLYTIKCWLQLELTFKTLSNERRLC
jgi:hypothetical protein